MKLRTKFNLGVCAVALVALSASGWISHQVLTSQAREEVIDRARMLMESALAVRGYTVNEVRPLVNAHPEFSNTFFPQTVPAYAAHQYIKNLQGNHPDYSYKEATLNPTNPADRATAWEADIVEYFRINDDAGEHVGTREASTGPSLYLSRPIKITNPGCLTCHSTAAEAPPTMIAKYGPSNGFGWKLNEVVGAQIVSVPMAVPLERANNAFWLFMGSLMLIFLAVIALLNVMLHMVVTRPIGAISEQADRVSKGALDVEELEVAGHDEIGSLGRSFNRMHRSLGKAVQLLDETLDPDSSSNSRSR